MTSKAFPMFKDLCDEQVNTHTHNTLRAFTVVVALPSAGLLLIPSCSISTQQQQNTFHQHKCSEWPPNPSQAPCATSSSSLVRHSTFLSSRLRSLPPALAPFQTTANAASSRMERDSSGRVTVRARPSVREESWKRLKKSGVS